MDTKLQSIKKQSTTAAVIQALQYYIKNNGLKPGDKMPSEHSLCESLNVSRIAIRESLQHFKSLGIIDSQPKRGAFIKKLMPDNPYKHYIPYIDTNCDSKIAKEIVQVRKIIDIGLAIELLDIIKPEHIKKLREKNKMLKNCDVKSFSMLDAEFHSYMLEIANNETLMGLKALVVDFFKKMHSKRKYKKSEIASVYREHEQIIDCLESSNEIELFIAVKQHYQQYKPNKDFFD